MVRMVPILLLAAAAGCLVVTDFDDYGLSSSQASGGSGAGAGSGGAPVPCDAPNVVCGDTCEDLQTSQTDCGSCEHDCFGAACLAGACQPEELAKELGPILRIAVDDTSVYWVVYGVDPCDLPGCTLDRIPKGGGAVEVMATGIKEATGLVVDATHVYVAAYSAGGGDGVRRVPKVGGPVETVAGCNTAFDVIVDDDYVFWVSGECGTIPPYVIRGDKGDPSQRITLVDDTPSGYAYAQWGYLAAGPDAIYWLNAKAVMTAPKVMSQVSVLLQPVPAPPRGIVRDDDGLWVVFGGDIYRVAEDGSSSDVVAAMQMTMPPEASFFMGIATDATHVYWPSDVEPGKSTGSIVALAKDPPGRQPIALASGQSQPIGVAVDATHVYWANADGSIWRVAK
jgi:hypothetical protein